MQVKSGITRDGSHIRQADRKNLVLNEWVFHRKTQRLQFDPIPEKVLEKEGRKNTLSRHTHHSKENEVHHTFPKQGNGRAKLLIILMHENTKYKKTTSIKKKLIQKHFRKEINR